jgi:hypothetical protein
MSNERTMITKKKVLIFGLPVDPSKLIQTDLGVRSHEHATPADYAGMSSAERREIAAAVVESWAEWAK